MSSNDTYLAVFLGDKESQRRKAWMEMPDAERQAKEQEGIVAWKGWMEAHRDSIVETGGPLGRTKRVSRDGVADAANPLAAFIVVRAASHEEAARMFEGHPHYTLFPGDAVEVMPLLPIPGA